MEEVMTVLGPITIEDLGITMLHTHLLTNLLCWYQEPAEASRIVLSNAQVRIDLLGILRRDCVAIKDNLILGDIDVAIEELMEYKKMGGRSLVEVTLPGIGRDHMGLKKISQATGINIICAAGWYVSFSHPAYVKDKTVDELCEIMVREITEGIDGTGIKAGVIGEIAMSGSPEMPFDREEEKILMASARAQAKTGVPLTIHPNAQGRHLHTYLDVLEKEGVNLNKVYMSHMEMYCDDVEYQKSVLDRGITISYDQFGLECYFDSIAPGYGFPTDRQRIKSLLELLEAGYEKQIVLSNECCFKIGYKRYGGYGYSHILENILPELRVKGIKEEKINSMLIENPKKLFIR